jgi:hypothetical protein
VNAALSTLTVSDFTGLGSGWRVSLSATPFAEKAPDGTWDTEGTRLTLPTGSMKLYPFSSTIASSGHSTAPTVSLISPVSIDGAGTIGLLSAAVGQGMDEYQYLFPAQSLTLNVGTQTKVDSINYPSTPTVFESTLSWTLVVGP